MKAPIPPPPAVAALDTDRKGRPVPWFVDRSGPRLAEPDFRIADHRKLLDAIRFELCWVCGRRRGRFGTFVVGPMCAVNRTSAEPPAHLECAVYSARACPFLTTPQMVRRDRDRPDGSVPPAGVALLRNPGVALCWTSKTFTHYAAPGGGVLFDLGDPVAMGWFCEGRTATRDEVLASITSGLPSLTEMAAAEGPAAVAELDARVRAVRRAV